MKYRRLCVVWGVAICAGLAALNSARAQGTLFTYQGRLLSNSVSISANYDMQFALFPALTGTNQVGVTLTNAPIAVSNGLFTATLDFGDVFTVNPLYLQIGVRTNGSTNAYTILSPRQLISSAPYAVQALNTANFTGAISDTQLSTNVPLLNGTQTFGGATTFSNASGKFNGTLSGTFSGAASGTFSGAATGTFTGTTSGTNTGKFIGDGSSISNVNITNVVGIVQSNPNWQLIQGTSQQAAVANNYLGTNNGLTTLTLPTGPGVGSTIWVAGSGASGWTIAQPSGQSILLGNLGLPGGQVWSAQATSQSWKCLASSASGLQLIAAVGNGLGDIYVSTNGGQNWTASDSPSANWYGLASSADGTHMAAAPDGNYIYTSTNGGLHWIQQTGSANTSWTCIASSANGVKLVAASGLGLGSIYTSTNSGTNWAPRLSGQNWTGVASSSDGTKLAASVNNGQIYTSSDSGLTWTNYGPTESWTSIASSADGTELVATVNFGNIYTSGDSGVTWTARATSESWVSCASSSNGLSLAAVYSGSGFIYTSSDAGQTWLQRTNGISTTGQNWTAITSSASGSRLLAGISTGMLYNSAASTTPGSTGSLSGSQYSNLQLQYIGNGQWMPLNFTGTFTGN